MFILFIQEKWWYICTCIRVMAVLAVVLRSAYKLGAAAWINSARCIMAIDLWCFVSLRASWRAFVWACQSEIRKTNVSYYRSCHVVIPFTRSSLACQFRTRGWGIKVDLPRLRRFDLFAVLRVLRICSKASSGLIKIISRSASVRSSSTNFVDIIFDKPTDGARTSIALAERLNGPCSITQHYLQF